MPIIDTKFNNPNRRKASTGDKFYQSKAWKRFRRQALIDDSHRDASIAIQMHADGAIGLDLYSFDYPMCAKCKAEDKINNGHIYDHIIPRSEGEEDMPADRTKMQWLCRRHDNIKRSSEIISRPVRDNRRK